MKTTKMSLLLIISILNATQPAAHAQPVAQTQLPEPVATTLSAKQIEILAKAAIVEELDTVNEGLRIESFEIPGYTQIQLKAFYKLGKTQIAPEYLFDKCIFTENDLGSILSETLTLGDDNVSSHRNSLGNVRSQYNPKIWRFVSRMCVNAKERFTSRLESLTSHGRPLSLSDETVYGLSNVIFYPTDHGKPSFKKGLLIAINAMMSGASLVGATSSLFGLPFAGLIMTVNGLLNTTIGIIRTSLPPRAGVGAGDFDGLQLAAETELDFSSLEMQLANS